MIAGDFGSTSFRSRDYALFLFRMIWDFLFGFDLMTSGLLICRRIFPVAFVLASDSVFWRLFVRL